MYRPKYCPVLHQIFPTCKKKNNNQLQFYPNFANALFTVVCNKLLHYAFKIEIHLIPLYLDFTTRLRKTYDVLHKLGETH